MHKTRQSVWRKTLSLRGSAAARAGALCLLLGAIPLAGLVNQEVSKPDTLYLGSSFELDLTSEAEITDVLVPDTLQAFAVKAKTVLKPKGRPKGLRLTIVALDTGEQVFPALTVKKLSPDRATELTRPFRLEIMETRAEQDSVLRELAPVHKVRGELPLWLYYALPPFLLLLALAALLWYLRQRRKKQSEQRRTAPALIDSRPNWKRALEDLYELNQKKLPQQGEFIAYYFRLSEIMKVYLESEYGFPANEMTTREIRHHLKYHHNLQLPEQEKLINWLQDGDRVKFAKYLPGLDECEASMDWFMRWLMQNRKTPAEGADGAES